MDIQNNVHFDIHINANRNNSWRKQNHITLMNFYIKYSYACGQKSFLYERTSVSRLITCARRVEFNLNCVEKVSQII
jgi:hypothetical protein